MFKKLENVTTVIFMLVVVIAGGLYISSQVKTSPEGIVVGSRIGTSVTPLAFDVIATSTITGFNTLDIGTTTPTSTEYIYLGAEVDQVDMFVYAQATSTDNSLLEWKLSFSPHSNRATSTLDFFFEDSNSLSGSIVTHVAADVVHNITLGDALVDKKKISICGANTDSAANTKISQCNAGVYKIEIGRPDGMSAFELYTEVISKLR